MGRIVMHLDMDSYFASVEQQAWPALRGKPIGVTGKPLETTIIVTASKEGKKYGLKPGMPVWEARRLCPNLILVPGRASRYISTTKRFLAILKRYSPILEVYSIDEVFMDVTQEAPCYGGPLAMARAIKDEFREALGRCVTATIGIAPNKTFAKLVAKKNKPDGIGILREDDIPALLEETPVGDVCGIGPRIEKRLARVGIRTLADLGRTSADYLKKEFGVYGLFLKELGQGRDGSPIVPYTEVPPPKSVGHSKTLPPAIRDFKLALLVLRSLCDRVGRRLRKLGYAGRTVYFWFSLGTFGPYSGKQTTLAYPTDDGEEIYRICLSIREKMGVQPEAVFQIGVSVRNLVPKDGLPDYLLAADRKRERLNRAVDLIRDRFGEGAIVTADSLLLEPIPEHVGGFAQGEDLTF